MKRRLAASGFLLAMMAPALAMIVEPPPAVRAPAMNTSRPAYNTAFKDPVLGARITRVTNDRSTPLTFLHSGGNLPSIGTWAGYSRPHKSQADGAFNADSTLLAVDNSPSTGGNPSKIYLDASTYQPSYGRCRNYSVYEDRWHPVLPTVRVNMQRDDDSDSCPNCGHTLEWWDVTTCGVYQGHTYNLQALSGIPDLHATGIGPGEGSISRDGRYVALADTSGTGTLVFVVEMEPLPGRLGPVTDLSAGCRLRSDCSLSRGGHVGISDSGNYVVVHYPGDHPRVYDLNKATLALTPRPYRESIGNCVTRAAADPVHGDASQGFIFNVAHPDFALNVFDGNEDYYVGTEHCGRFGTRQTTLLGQKEILGRVIEIRLSDGGIAPLTHRLATCGPRGNQECEQTPHHVSARNIRKPGWVFVTYTQNPVPGITWYDGQIVMEKLRGPADAAKMAREVAFHRAKEDTIDGDEDEAKATPNQRGSKIAWGGNYCAGMSPGCPMAPPSGQSVEYKAWVAEFLDVEQATPADGADLNVTNAKLTAASLGATGNPGFDFQVHGPVAGCLSSRPDNLCAAPLLKSSGWGGPSFDAGRGAPALTECSWYGWLVKGKNGDPDPGIPSTSGCRGFHTRKKPGAQDCRCPS